MAVLVDRFIDRDNGFSVVRWCVRCDNCRAEGPWQAGEALTGITSPPEGWSQGYRGSLLVAQCPSCRSAGVLP